MAETRKPDFDDALEEPHDAPESGDREDLVLEDDDDPCEPDGAIEPPRRGIDVTQSAVVSVCWNNGGNKLIGLLIVRRTDGHSVFMRLPMDLEKKLDTLDRHAVARHSSWLLETAAAMMATCDYEADDLIPADYLLEGDCPATLGTMRHIGGGIDDVRGRRSWRDTLYLVDVGDVDLEHWRAANVH
jgi:hypothetical protein